MCVCVCMCVRVTFQKLPWSGLEFNFFLLQFLSRIQNHEGFRQEKALGQVKGAEVTGGVAWPLPRQTSWPPTSVPEEGRGGRGEGKQPK